MPGVAGRVSRVRGYNRWMTFVLTARDRAQLKARAHALEPVVQVGQAGVTEALIAEVDRALTAHGLIKVKLAGADREARAAMAEALCAAAGAADVQQVGKVLVMWRPKPEAGD